MLFPFPWLTSLLSSFHEIQILTESHNYGIDTEIRHHGLSTAGGRWSQQQKTEVGGDKTGLSPVTRYKLSQISTDVSWEILAENFRNFIAIFPKICWRIFFTLYVLIIIVRFKSTQLQSDAVI